jgi:hypothetical protein
MEMDKPGVYMDGCAWSILYLAVPFETHDQILRWQPRLVRQFAGDLHLHPFVLKQMLLPSTQCVTMLTVPSEKMMIIIWCTLIYR